MVVQSELGLLKLGQYWGTKSPLWGHSRLLAKNEKA
jgi:hypothetical protein